MQSLVDYKRELQELIDVPLSSLVGLGGEQMLLTIYVAGVNRGVAIGFLRAVKAENGKLVGIGGRSDSKT